MIKKALILLLFIFTLCPSLVKAQIGREWIAAGQPYYKIPVTEEAVYQITFNELNNKGIATTDPDKLQIWFRGKEQSIYINNNTLYFYGKGNDGALDSMLYEPYSSRYSKYYSLFSDTTYYFLTVGTSNGKRLNANTNSVSTLQDYHRHVETLFYTDDYYAGRLYNSDTHLTPGDVGEGWFGTTIAQSGSNPAMQSVDVPVSNLFSSGPDPELEILLVGGNQNGHNVDIIINNSLVYSLPPFYARSISQFKQTIPLSSLTNNQPLQVTVKVKGITPDQPDYVAIAYIILRYPQTTNLSGKTFYKIEPVSDNNAKTFSLTGFSNGSLLWDISSEGAYVDLNYSYSGGTATANVSSGTSSILYANTFKSVIGINPVDMTPYPVGTAQMLLISHTKLLAGSNSGVSQYAQHRSSIAGGSVSVAVTDITRLYDLYTYGEKHPMAIRRYCQEELNGGVAKYLFLVGKGVNYDFYGKTSSTDYDYYRKNPNAFINNPLTNGIENYKMEDLIPAYGWPSSDWYYTITDGTLRPKLATGRLSARTDADVLQYLDKVTTTEGLSSDKLWRKNLLHLSGGKTGSEVSSFRGVVDGFKTIAEGPRFGGKVVATFQKNLSAGTVDNKLIFSIADEVNKGLSYITFFGHSSPNIIDLDIGTVSNPVYGYDNKDKYPVLIINGCQSAEFFVQSSIPEDWIMTPKKGAVLTLGHGDIGYPSYMQKYCDYFYRLNFADGRYINNSVGEIQKKTIDTFLTYFDGIHDSNVEIYRAQATQYVLQGDPSLKVYKPQMTDYAISGDEEAGEEKVFLKPYGTDHITAMSDSIIIAIPIINYGLSNVKKIQMKVRHTVSSNNSLVFDVTYPLKTYDPVGYSDTVFFVIPAKNKNLYGINKFEIYIDPNDSIPESNEQNNKATLEYFISLSSVSCLYPAEYSVVHEQPVAFFAQSNDLLQPERNYYIEIDTNHLFQSPGKIINIVSSGALVKFTQIALLTDVSPSDSIVYYWRIRFQDIASGEDTLWGESSFIYIKNSPNGWSQSEYPQFFKDTYKGITISDTGKYSFIKNTNQIFAQVQGNASGNSWTTAIINMNGVPLLNNDPEGYPGQCSLEDGLLIVVFDAQQGNPFVIDSNRFCGIYGNARVHKYFVMYNLGNQNYVQALLEKVKPNEFVLMMSAGTCYFDQWNSGLKDYIANQFGSQHINELGEKSPFILLAKKGAGTAIAESYSTDDTQLLTLNGAIDASYRKGSITSTLIGPSSSWGTFYKTVNKSSNDEADLSVILIDPNGNEKDTIPITVPLNDDIDLNSLINATTYPYIRLLLNTTDTIDVTPAYLKKWQVIYAPVPEGTLDAFKVGVDNYSITTKDIGTVFTVPFAFQNISDVDFPTALKVVFYIKNEAGATKRDTVTIGLLPKGQVTLFNYTINTAGFGGKNTFQAYVNPKFQPEVYYQNNIIELTYSVLDDKTHPVIGAMFDNVHIFDGDIVSPSPTISIMLVDNNRLLTMSDSTMSITLIYPGGISHIIRKNDPSTGFTTPQWGQDPTDKGKFRVDFKPNDNLPDGTYKLIVQGKDASGNRSGNQNLEINFEVMNASTITNFYPYPNPFSTSCRFVFTLTGLDIPEDIKIQIMTVSGKVVREIFKAELGNIHIGDNITDYAWDGRDEFGDKLANGVYVYRVLIKNQNDKFDHRETSGDKAFKKGYGKLYILR